MEKLVVTLTLMLMICLSSEAQIVSETKKIMRLHFYLHDVLGADSATDWTVAQCKLTNVLPLSFGMVLVLDNLVTSEPELDSGEVGRMQGTVAMADLRETALVMLINLVFTKGEFEGSTLSISSAVNIWPPSRGSLPSWPAPVPLGWPRVISSLALIIKTLLMFVVFLSKLRSSIIWIQRQALK